MILNFIFYYLLCLNQLRICGQKLKKKNIFGGVDNLWPGVIVFLKNIFF